MKIKTIAISLYQHDNGMSNSITDEDIQNEINKRLEEAGVTTENIIDIKMNTQFYDWSQSNDSLTSISTMVVWNILIAYKGE